MFSKIYDQLPSDEKARADTMGNFCHDLLILFDHTLAGTSDTHKIEYWGEPFAFATWYLEFRHPAISDPIGVQLRINASDIIRAEYKVSLFYQVVQSYAQAIYNKFGDA